MAILDSPRRGRPKKESTMDAIALRLPQELADEMQPPFLGRVTMREEFLDPAQPAVLESDEVANEFSEIALKVRQLAQSAV